MKRVARTHQTTWFLAVNDCEKHERVGCETKVERFHGEGIARAEDYEDIRS